ncbi:Glycosyltransferase, catalytic subunit of cellulose synthase and poly-beta-1,6-N-acetylglucosamine synthase [Chitinophaga costaii]|uniref:Glycosyltransferase, catalytic subunit of cellulose synthase and poly-beta-1,6-N-acetylglucosamine synthase n=1 Tax=Chitinophaga costaii TaxID=1335309 RepID=A0A1C4FI70_9BACT|nr:glycosyltransferase [Chitinophaga costaii]SCC55554.1 Glycosyltransferase, catalytic subunit of cellulose synthase and poly-beta-1,6-N-acetylglucosamine synthase [Chitinophaga costaii]
MSAVLYTFFIVLQVILLFYLLIPTFFLVLYWLKRLLGRKPRTWGALQLENTKEYSFAAIITAHKNLELVPPLVDSLLKQHYRNYKIYVVADACEEVTLHFDDPTVIILQPPTALNAKIKSIDYAINHFVEPHDALIIFDADNLVHPDYLAILNVYFNRGYRAVQTNMLPKNTDSLMARLDAAGNLYYNFIDRRMRMELGMSAHIWGLGIAIETALYKSILYQNFLGGFDKKVQADIVRQVPILAYAEDAIVYDEKIDSGAALEKQRTRWLYAYFKYFRYSVAVLWAGITRFSFNLFFFGLQLLRPPILLQLLAAALFFLINVVVSPTWAWYWVGTGVVFVLTFFGIVASMTRNKEIVNALYSLPLVLFHQLRALFNMKRATKAYLKTENSKVVYIQDLLNTKK